MLIKRFITNAGVLLLSALSCSAFADGFATDPTPESSRGVYGFSFENQIYVFCQGGISVKGSIPLQTWFEGATYEQYKNAYYGVESSTGKFYKVLMVQDGAYFPNFTPEETRRMGGTVEDVNGVKCESPDYSQPLAFAYEQYGVQYCPKGQTVGGKPDGSDQRWGYVEIWSESDKKGNVSSYMKNGKTGAFTPFVYDDYPSLNEEPDYALPGSVIVEQNGVWDADSQEECAPVQTSQVVAETRQQACAVGETGSKTETRNVTVYFESGVEVKREPLTDWTLSESSCAAVPPTEPTEPTEPETPVTPDPVWESAGNASVSFTCPAGQVVGGAFGAGNVREGLIPYFTKGSDYGFKAADGSFSVVAVNKAQDGTVSVPGAKESDVATYGGKWLAGSEQACAETTQWQQASSYETKTVACSEAQVGKIVYGYTTEYEIDKDGNKRNETVTQKVVENSCKDLEDALLEEKEVTKSEQCPNGQYGSITVKGKNVTNGLSGTKFVETERINNCVAELNTFEKETQVRDCPAGQVGQINEYMMKAVNTSGETVYPYGNEWIQESNTCTNPVAADSDSTGETDKAKGLLSNQTLKASDNVNLDKLLNYLNVVQDVSPSPDYKLNIVLDTFDNINLEKIQAVATKWKAVSGGKVVLGDAPRFAKSYIGYDAITKDNVNEFVIIAAHYSNGNIIVTAKQVGKMTTRKNIIFNVPFAKI